MMILQIVSEDKSLLHEIADDLLMTTLIAKAMISKDVAFKCIDRHNRIRETIQYTLKGIFKSLLFSKINLRLRKKYGKHTPLIYSEPVIMIDPEQTEEILAKLASV